MVKRPITYTWFRLAAITTLVSLVSMIGVGCGSDDSDDSTNHEGPGTSGPYSIRGMVTGDNVADVTILLTGAAVRTATTAESGAYSFEGLSDGTYTLTPSLKGHIFDPIEKAVEISGANPGNVNFRSTKENIAGSDNTPPSPSPSIWEVEPYAISDTEITMTAATASDPSGGVEYRFRNLAPAPEGTNAPWQSSPEFTATGLTPNTRYSFKVKTRDAEGNVGTYSETLSATTLGDIETGDYSISGTITGDVSVNVLITLSGTGIMTTATNASGEYSFNNLPSGEYTIIPSLGGYRFTEMSETVSVANDDVSEVDFTSASTPPADVSIDAVYFAQSHVMKATNPNFRLVGNRKTLIKAHVIGPAMSPAPSVTATLSLDDGSSTTISLSGPATLPVSIPDGPGVVQHSLDDTFTAFIPKEWVKPGLDVTINAGGKKVTHADLSVGAPTRMRHRLMSIKYFSNVEGGIGESSEADFPDDWAEEWAQKMPLAELEVIDTPCIHLEHVLIPPYAPGEPAYLVPSGNEYTKLTGRRVNDALTLNAYTKFVGYVIQSASGRSNVTQTQYLGIHNYTNGGVAFAGEGFMAAGGPGSPIMLHEIGHTYNLQHNPEAYYPYIGDWHGMPAASETTTHVGDIWGFDSRSKTFIPPIVQPDNVGGATVGELKHDPMRGGGSGGQEPGFNYTYFSDFNYKRMIDEIERLHTVWNDSLGGYYRWNETDGDYTTPVDTSNPLFYPSVRNVGVYTLFGQVYDADPTACQVYPPIGAYTSDLIPLYDPSVAKDRADAQAHMEDCDYSLRVTQSGSAKVYMLGVSRDSTMTWADKNAKYGDMFAINIPASAGPVEKIELLQTPDAQIDGLGTNPTVLFTWSTSIPKVATFAMVPTAAPRDTVITMKATAVQTSATGQVQYRFTETSGNSEPSSTVWQDSPTYTRTGLVQGTTYTYTVQMKEKDADEDEASAPSAPLSATVAKVATPVSFTPVAGSTNINPDSQVLTVGFDRNIAIGTGEVTLRRTIDGSTISIDVTDDALVSVSGSDLNIKLAPLSQDLVSLRQYMVTLDPSTVVGRDGSPFKGISAENNWTFTTGLAPEDNSASIVINDIAFGINDKDNPARPRLLASSTGSVTASKATETGTSYTITGLDLTPLGGGANETINFDVKFTTTPSTAELGADGYSRIKVISNGDPAKEYGIEDGEKLTMSIVPDSIDSTYDGEVSIGLTGVLYDLLNNDETAVVDYDGGQIIEPGAGEPDWATFPASSFFTTYPPAGDAYSHPRVYGMTIEIQLNKK